MCWVRSHILQLQAPVDRQITTRQTTGTCQPAPLPPDCKKYGNFKAVSFPPSPKKIFHYQTIGRLPTVRLLLYAWSNYYGVLPIQHWHQYKSTQYLDNVYTLSLIAFKVRRPERQSQFTCMSLWKFDLAWRDASLYVIGNKRPLVDYITNP